MHSVQISKYQLLSTWESTRLYLWACSNMPLLLQQKDTEVSTYGNKFYLYEQSYNHTYFRVELENLMSHQVLLHEI